MRFAVAKFLKEAGLSSGDRILVGISGGADSVALLHLLRSLAEELSFCVYAAHLDHALRPQSAGDARFVSELCRQWGVSLALRRIDVRIEARRVGAGIEEGARLVRRAFLEESASQRDCRWIALGHHRGDQAETVLHRFVRGTAVSGLAAMAATDAPYLRPLLGFGRSRILHYLREHGLSWREDESNADPAYTRNRLRNEILPLLAEFNPRLEEHLLLLSRRIALEEDYWRGEEVRALSRVRTWRGDELRLERAPLLELHPALRSRVIRRAVLEARGDLQGVGAAHLESVEGLLRGPRPQAEVHLPGLLIRRRYETLILSASFPACEPFAFELRGPGRYPLPGGCMLEVLAVPESLGESLEAVEFDAGAIPFPLTVRSFLPGDRFRPSGSAGGKKLKDFFIDRKLARELRRTLPLVVSDEVLWVAGVRRCHGRRPVAGRPVLRLVLHCDQGP